MISVCCACHDALFSSPGKKGIILFLGSFCPPSIGNLSRIRICKSEGESKEWHKHELCSKAQKHAFLFATKKMHVNINGKASLSFHCWLNHMNWILSTSLSVKVESGGIWDENRNKKKGLQTLQEQSTSLLRYMRSTRGCNYISSEELLCRATTNGFTLISGAADKVTSPTLIPKSKTSST